MSNNIFLSKQLKKKSGRVYECQRNKVQSEYHNVKRIIAIGDIHGDLNVLKKCLLKAKLVDPVNYNWIGKDTFVVQVGDILDGGGRGYNNNVNPMEEYQIFDLLNKLDRQAVQKGGRVFYLIGNHEIMNFMGNFNYVHENQLINSVVRKKLFSKGGYMARLLACHAYAVLKINNWYFCHAGLTFEHLENGFNIDKINILTKQVLRGEKNPEQITEYEKNLLFSSNGLFWNRKYSKDNRCSILNKTLEVLGSKNGGMIVGHTIINRKITKFCNDKLIFTDIGMSSAFGGDNCEVLEIKKNGKPRVI
tara:strand:- start:1501 stop:2415 length:915 start_codon:yes stop_codon:yes gene_type:complete